MTGISETMGERLTNMYWVLDRRTFLEFRLLSEDGETEGVKSEGHRLSETSQEKRFNSGRRV